MKDFAYVAWDAMRRRCRAEEAKFRAYADCTIHPDFVEFPAFKAWAVEQVGYGTPGYHMDKDIISPGRREYGPETCAFVPREVNHFLHANRWRRDIMPIGVQKHGRKYRAIISIEGKLVYCGTSATPLGAFALYKAAKEVEAKRIAEKWRSAIDPRVYEALMNYSVGLLD